MIELCDHKTLAAGTIAGGAVSEPYDVRLDMRERRAKQ
jgi:hypothetical protein